MPLTGHKGFTLSEETEAALPCAFAFLRHLSPPLPPAQPHFSFSGEDCICLSERKRAVQESWPTACSARIQVLLLLAKRHTQFSHTFFHPCKVHRRFLRDVLPAWGEIRSSSCPAALLSLPEEERNGTPASTGRIGRLLHDSFLQILLQICPYLLRSPFRSHFGHIAVHHQVDKLFKAGTVRIPSEFSLRLRRVAP